MTAESTWLSLRVDVAGLPLGATKAIFTYLFNVLRETRTFNDGSGLSWALDALPTICTTCAAMKRDRLRDAYYEVESHHHALIGMYVAFNDKRVHIAGETLRAAHRDAVGSQAWRPAGTGPEVRPDVYAGLYASDQDWVPERRRRSPQIATQVQTWCAELETELNNLELANKLDPFHLAAKYSLSLYRMSPFANANGRIARIGAMAIIRRYTFGGAMSLGSMPVNVSLCSDMMDSAFFGATPENFARFLFSRTLESTKRLYT